jgi:hypothetical protein
MWANLDENTRSAVTAAHDAPTDAGLGLADTTWLPLFYNYLLANAADQTTLNAVLVADAVNRDETVTNLFAMVNTEGTHPFPIDMDSLYLQLAMPAPGEEDHLANELRSGAGTYTQAWWSVFVQEVTAMREWEARADVIDQWKDEAGENPEGVDETEGMAVASSLTMADLDAGYIDRLNEYELKELAEGAWADFVQAGAVLLIGDNFPPAYVSAVHTAGSQTQTLAQGQVTMVAKGSTFSAGRISVAYSAGGDPDNAKVALRRVTKKSIAFG